MDKAFKRYEQGFQRNIVLKGSIPLEEVVRKSVTFVSIIIPMKNILSHLCAYVLLLLPAGMVEAQKIKEGKITYGITYPESQLDQQTMAMMPGESVLFFKNGKLRTEINMPMASSVFIEDGQKGSGTMLMDAMGNKFSVDVNREKIIGDRFQQPKVNLTDETKTIAGYNCKKANVAVRNKEEDDMHEFDVWFTTDIAASNGFATQIEGIDGFMLEYESFQNGMRMKMTARKVEKIPVEDAKFVLPSGYKPVSEEDLKNMRNNGK